MHAAVTYFRNTLYERGITCEVEREGRFVRSKRGRVKRGSGRQKEKPINFTMANSETVATPFLQFTEVIKV